METHIDGDEWFANGSVYEPDPRVLLADHDPISRYVLGSVLRGTGQLQFVAGVDSRRPLREWPTDRLDVAVLSVGPQEDQARLVQELTRHKVQVLVIGVGWTRPRLDAVLAAGAAGCLVKDTRIGGLATAVRAVASGHVVLSPELLALQRARGHRAPVPGPAAPPAGDDPSRLIRSLTDRERQVLTLLAQGGSTAEVAEVLSVSPATVKSHISHALGKLGARNRLEAVLMVQREMTGGGP